MNNVLLPTTIYLDQEIDRRISQLSFAANKTKSQLAVELVREGLNHLRIQSVKPLTAKKYVKSQVTSNIDHLIGILATNIKPYDKATVRQAFEKHVASNVAKEMHESLS